MAIVTRTREQGYLKVSEGAAQIQNRTTSESLGFIHAVEQPVADVTPEFIIIGSGIELTFVDLPCWVIGDATFAYGDIS